MMNQRIELPANDGASRDLVQLAMRINGEAGSIHAWIFLKKNGFRDEDIVNLLRHTPELQVVQ